LRDIVPSKAVKNFMKLQIVADGQKQVAILSSKDKRDSDINSAQREAKAIVLEAEAIKKA
jgi:regulator of protease activity HflC (stomatin/prohibitin superfamily)